MTKKPRLRMLKPSLATLNTGLRTLSKTAGATPRDRGRPWRRLRARILASQPLCVRCLERDGRVTLATELDHRLPLAQGGTDAESNLDPLCADCHRAKTAADGAAR